MEIESMFAESIRGTPILCIYISFIHVNSDILDWNMSTLSTQLECRIREKEFINSIR